MGAMMRYDLHHVLVVLEGDVGHLQATLTLDVDLLRPVDHDFSDGLVAQERLQRAEAQDLVGDLLEHAHPLGAGEGQTLLVGDLAEQLLDLATDLDLVGQVELRIQLVDEPVLDAVLRLAERFAGGHCSKERARRGAGAAWARWRGCWLSAARRRNGGRLWGSGNLRLPLAAWTRSLDPLQQ